MAQKDAVRTGRPRSEEAERAIIEAALDLLAEVGPDGCSVETVAARAGVGKTTIYRRWSTKDELLLAAVQSLRGELPQAPATPDLREALRQCVEGMNQMHDDPRYARLVPRLFGVADTYPEIYQEYVDQAIRPRRTIVLTVLRRGIAEGVIDPDVDLGLALDLLVGPVLLRAFRSTAGEVSGDEFSSPSAQILVDTVLSGLAPR